MTTFTLEQLQNLSGDELKTHLATLPTIDSIDYIDNYNSVDKAILLLNKLEAYDLSDEDIRLFIIRNLL